MWGLQNYEGMLVTIVVTLVVGSGLIVLTLLFGVLWKMIKNLLEQIHYLSLHLKESDEDSSMH